MLASMVSSALFFTRSSIISFEVQMRLTARCSEGMFALLVRFDLSITVMLRASIESRVAKEKGLEVIFLESICTDPAVIAANIALKVSSGDPDYNEVSRDEAERDFRRRIEQYERVYETITEPHLSSIKITNVGEEVTLSRINGYLQSRIAFYLMNLHLKPRSIFFSRVSTCITAIVILSYIYVKEAD
jgi:hypothetical protein